MKIFVFVGLVIITLLPLQTIAVGFNCSPEQLLSEKNATEKIYCYAEKFNFGRGDWEDAYMNDPIFLELLPIATQIITIENKPQPTYFDNVNKQNLENQIKSIFQREENLAEAARKSQEEKAANDKRNLLITIVGSVLALGFVTDKFRSYFSEEKIVQRSEIRGERQRQDEQQKIERQHMLQNEQYRIQQKHQREKERIISEYHELRKRIETMPQYAMWRNAILERDNRACVICGKKELLEVDHRYKSFYSIVTRNNITNQVQAYECSELWDSTNGATLCQEHHRQTQSSQHYHSLN